VKIRENKAGRVNWVQKREEGKTLEDYQRILRRYATPWEKKFKKILKRWCEIKGTRFVFQRIFWTGEQGYIADFYLPDYRMVFELDGKHHLEGEQKEKDEERDRWFKGQSIRVVRVQNREVDSVGPQEIIEAAVQGRKRKRLPIRSEVNVRARKKLESQCFKEIDENGLEITICPEITQVMVEKGEKNGRRRKRKKLGCRKEAPGTFRNSVLWKG